MNNTDIYKVCPEFDTEHFHLRCVCESDAEALLKCYSDPAAQKFFNADNCSFPFNFNTIEEMENCIRFWLRSNNFVRWSIVDKQDEKAVGTVEMFGHSHWHMTRNFPGGCLRVDIASEYETADYLSELLKLANEHFFGLFDAEIMVVKAIPEAAERIAALKANGFAPYELSNPNFTHYYATAFDAGRELIK
jgi:RimJ/RimL family protein N-acetyltransferase